MKRSLDTSSKIMETSMERLSSGLRINSAADDPANLGISEALDVKISSLDVANDNIKLGMNKMNIYDAHLESLVDLFNSARDMTISAASGTYTPAALAEFDNQVQNILANAEDIANEANTEVGAAAVLLTDVAFAPNSMVIQVGINNDPESRFTLDELGVGFAPVESGFTYANVDLTTQANAQASLTEIDAMLDYLNSKRSYVGAQVNILDTIKENNSNKSMRHSEGLSIIRDADIAQETAELTKQQIIQETTMMLISQIGEMQGNLVLNLL